MSIPILTTRVDNCDSTKIVTRPSRRDEGPVIHYGLIASGNQVVKNSTFRDRLAADIGAYCVEMEAAGLMNEFPCLVIRESVTMRIRTKTKQWQGYAATRRSGLYQGTVISDPCELIQSGRGHQVANARLDSSIRQEPSVFRP